MNDEATPKSRTAPGSVWSLVLGILGVTCCGIFTAVPAVICGHVSYSKVKKSGGALAGDGMALAGLILGYIGIAITIIVVPLQLAVAIPAFMKARATAQQNVCINNLRQIEGAKDAYAIKSECSNGWAFANDAEAFNALVEAPGYLKGYPACPKSKSLHGEGTKERAVDDYGVNAIGSVPVCKVCPGEHALK